MMEMWKWNLAFQCVVNIGVRGSENVRTRVVEADMVPVIATILDNYIKVVEKCREKAEEAKQKSLQNHYHRSGHKGASFTNRTPRVDAEHRTFRRQAPPPSIEIPGALAHMMADHPHAMDATPLGPQYGVTSPPPAERRSFSSRHPHDHLQHRNHFLPPSRQIIQPLASANTNMDATDGFNLRPVREMDRLPSMLPGFHSGVTSQPESPTTPLPPVQLRSPTVQPTSFSASNARSRRRPSIRHQVSSVNETTEDLNADSMASDESGDADISGAQSPVGMQDIRMDDSDSLLTGDHLVTAVESPLGLTTPTVSETQDAGTFNISHGSLMNDATTPTGPTMGLSPAQTTATNTPSLMPTNTIPRYLLDRPTPTNAQVLAAMPRDEDVLLSLQLLAYVSKYCNLRSYFHKSHLVPKLKIGNELHLLDQEDGDMVCLPGDEEPEEEYLLPDDFNIFPLVEKFTVKYQSHDMQYWAGVVMRNLCRKDDSRGGIRQCAYYQCGKWEKCTREFAKCRRCRRTKYCSKECQKSAWIYHRHWCVSAGP